MSRRALLLALFAIPLSAGEDASVLLKEFHLRFDKEPKAPRRREAVLSMKGHADPRIASELAALIPKRLAATDEASVQGILEVLASFDTVESVQPVLDLALKPRAPVKHLLFAREALKACRNPAVLKILSERGLGSPHPLVQEAFADVMAEAAWAPAAKPLRKLLEHPDPRVRASGAEAFARCSTGDSKAAAALKPLLEAPEPIVSDAALAGLAWLRDAGSWDRIEKALITGVWPLKLKVARALGTWKGDERAVLALVQALEREKGRLVPVLADALARATGKDLGSDPKAWRDWWELGHGGKARTSEVDTRAKPHEYFDVRYFADRVVFVKDVSGSMAFGEGGPDAGKLKIDRSKEALARAVAALGPEVRFNLIPFASEVTPWKPDSVRATPENLKEAAEYIRGLLARGGTNIRDALLAASGEIMKHRPKGGFSTSYHSEGSDTLFLLTDGRPNRMGAWDDPYDILAEFTFANRFQGIQLFTLGMTGDPKSQDDIDPVFLELLARWNGGTYTFLK